MEKHSRHTAKPIGDLPTLDASGIAEYIRFDCCPRYFKLRFEGDEESSHRWPEAFKPLSPLLYGAGKELEEKTVETLKAKAASYDDLTRIDPKKMEWERAWAESLEILTQLIQQAFSATPDDRYKPALVYQAPMMGRIGMWQIKGIADLIGMWPSQGWES